MEIQIPKIIEQAFKKVKRHIILHGGRGSGKSESVARILLLEAMNSPVKILCCREFQTSIKDSVHSSLESIINQYNMDSFFQVTNNEIRGANGSLFLFKGLKKETAGSIKSISKVNICWIEEAQYISRTSLDILLPSIREEKSVIIFTMNPENEDDPVYYDFVKTHRDDAVVCQVNHNDNPFFPQVLQEQMEWDRANDYDKYLHVWEGQPVKHSEAQVFNGKWVVDNIDIRENDDVYFGADWGFSNDATTLVKMCIRDNKLYILDEVYQVHLELPNILPAFQRIHDNKYTIISDNARPETISYLKNQGLNIKGCTKWSGSIEDGVSFIKSFEKIIIDPKCKNTISEFQLYSYKTHRQTGEILNVIEDKNNHCIDAIRYGLEHWIRNKNVKKSTISAFQLGL